MENLTARPLKRGEMVRGDWVSSADHLTDGGKAAFAMRLKAYAKVKPTAQSIVRQIRK